MACMRGYEDILKTAGYTEKKEDSLQFPESIQEPDKQKLYVIAAELLMARLEVDRMNPASQSQQQQAESSSSPFNQRRVQTALVSSTTGSGMAGGVGSSQWGSQQGQNYGRTGGDQIQQQLPQQPGYQQQQQQYSSRTTVLGYNYGGGTSQSVAAHPGYGEQAAPQREMHRQQQFQLGHHLEYQLGYRLSSTPEMKCLDQIRQDTMLRSVSDTCRSSDHPMSPIYMSTWMSRPEAEEKSSSSDQTCVLNVQSL